jgi:hypothetical protein
VTIVAVPMAFLCPMILTGKAAGQEPAKQQKPSAASQGDVKILEELKNLQAALDKLQNEVKQLRTELKTAKTLEVEEATKKFVKLFTTAYLDAVLKFEKVDAATMLSKSLKDQLGTVDGQQEYASPLGFAGKGVDGAQWKAWSIDSQEWAPNCKTVIIKGKFLGKYEQKDIALPFALHVCYEAEIELWRVCLFRIGFKK